MTGEMVYRGVAQVPQPPIMPIQGPPAMEARSRLAQNLCDARDFVAMVGVGGAAALFGMNALLVPSDGSDIGDHLARSAGFECGTLSGGWSFPLGGAPALKCADRREGTMAIVNVGGLDPITSIPFTDKELKKIGEDVVFRLSILSDGAINLVPVVYEAPQAVTDEVKKHRVQTDTGDCIDSSGDHTTSKVAAEQMPELSQAVSVVALGGTSCAGSIVSGSKKVEAGLGGVAHVSGAGRLADIYSGSYGSQGDRAGAMRGLVEVILHEKLHLLGLDHTDEVVCDSKEYSIDASKPIDLDAHIQRLLGETAHCKYNEYGDGNNIMGAHAPQGEDRQGAEFARELLTGIQADFISLREPSSPGARTLRVDGSDEYILTKRPTGNEDSTKPYSLVTSLPKQIEYSVEGTDVNHAFTSIVFDYVNQPGLRGLVRVYLANDFESDQLRLMKVGHFYVDSKPMPVKLGDMMFTFESDEKAGVMKVTSAPAGP